MLFNFPFLCKTHFFFQFLGATNFIFGRETTSSIEFTSMTFIGHHTFQKALLSISKMDGFFTMYESCSWFILKIQCRLKVYNRNLSSIM